MPVVSHTMRDGKTILSERQAQWRLDAIKRLLEEIKSHEPCFGRLCIDYEAVELQLRDLRVEFAGGSY